jgi:anti-anti-sigma factor
MAFEGSVRRAGEVAVIDLHGEIDGQADEALNGAYAEADVTGAPTVLLNFADVTYINSTGIALIVGILAQARQKDRGVRACGLSEHYKEIFEITRLVDFVKIYEDEATALAPA